MKKKSNVDPKYYESKILELSFDINDVTFKTDDLTAVFDYFKLAYGGKIKNFVGCTNEEVADFGLGSLWLFEMPVKISLAFAEYRTILTIEKLR